VFSNYADSTSIIVIFLFICAHQSILLNKTPMKTTHTMF